MRPSGPIRKPKQRWARCVYYFLYYLVPCGLILFVIGSIVYGLWVTDSATRFWCLLGLGIVAAIGIGIFAFKRLTLRRVRKHKHFAAECSTCNYDLKQTATTMNGAGIPSASTRCPECGRLQSVLRDDSMVKS